LLINRVPGYIRKPFFETPSDAPSSQTDDDHADEVLKVEQLDTIKALSILDVDFHIHTGFQLSTLTGPLCAEPMTGVCYIVQNVTINQQAMIGANGELMDGMTNDQKHGNIQSLIVFFFFLVRSKLGLLQGQVISVMKDACRQGFLDWSPRLLLAMYTCDIQTSGKEMMGMMLKIKVANASVLVCRGCAGPCVWCDFQTQGQDHLGRFEGRDSILADQCSPPRG
jgi:ribosome assembly protein 1